MPLTFWQLQTMVIGRKRSEWEQTASILALVRNACGDKKATPESMNPFRDRRKESASKIALTMNDLKAVFGVRKKKRIPK